MDLQNDFCEGGALAVPGANAIIPVINKLMPTFELVIATMDWHPEGHCSFRSSHDDKYAGNEQLWPDHCVQCTFGSELHPELDSDCIDKVIAKGTHDHADSYSGFYDNNGMYSTELDKFLQEKKINDLVICGLATDYCVKYTVLDALMLKYTAIVILDACAGVDVTEGDANKAVVEMIRAGAVVIPSDQYLKGGE